MHVFLEKKEISTGLSADQHFQSFHGLRLFCDVSVSCTSLPPL